MSVDGAPTIYCFHSSCAPVVAEACRTLRRTIGQSPWEITLPGGRVLRNGDVLESSGTVLLREVVLARARTEGRDAGEQMNLETLKALAERFKPELFELFHWPFAKIAEDSPLQVHERDAEDQFRTWLRLWPAHCHVWIGDVFSSGKPEHKTHFRPVADWYQIGPARPASLRAPRRKAGRSHAQRKTRATVRPCRPILLIPTTTRARWRGCGRVM